MAKQKNKKKGEKYIYISRVGLPYVQECLLLIFSPDDIYRNEDMITGD